jgi:hypothetical protein
VSLINIRLKLNFSKAAFSQNGGEQVEKFIKGKVLLDRLKK